MVSVGYSHHLVSLVARVEAAATRLAGSDPDRRAELARTARARAAWLSARLDGSPVTPRTAEAVEAGAVPVLPHPPPVESAAAGWARALAIESMATQDVAAVEYANLRTLDGLAGDLAEAMMDHPTDTLRRLHGVIVQGLVDPELIGAPRRTQQAVHDGAQGKVLYNAPPPDRVAPMLDGLAEVIRRRSIVLHPAITAGVVHEQLLEIQPFEAGNGRVARAAARLVLIAGGIDPWGAAVVEAHLWADPTGYYGEVAATVRRGGELTLWLERHTAAVARALETAADELDPRPRPALPERGRSLIDPLRPGEEISLRDYATDAGVSLRVARADLAAFARAGLLHDAPGAGGLRYRRSGERVG